MLAMWLTSTVTHPNKMYCKNDLIIRITYSCRAMAQQTGRIHHLVQGAGEIEGKRGIAARFTEDSRRSLWHGRYIPQIVY